MNILEIFALIIIILAAIKILTILYKPELWFSMVGKLYVIPQLVSLIALILSGVVLYFLMNAGLTIVEILSVCLFIALLIIVGVANFSEELIIWMKQQDMSLMLRKVWIYLIAWIVLLGWGVQEIFFE